MATLIDGLREYVGLSNETKPTEGVAAGKKFRELDTGKVFLFDGTEWYRIDDDRNQTAQLDAANETLGAILTELRTMRELLQLATA